MTEKERIEKLNKIIQNSIPLKNDVFMIFAKNKEFCQEFLRVILEDNDLVVVDNDVQKVIPTAFNKNVVLDMLCRLKGGELANVEIQLKYEKSHAKRILSYASKLRVYDLGKGDDYEKANQIIIIYLTLEDIFKKGSTVYEVKMDIVSDQGENVSKWDAGLKVYYVNTKGLTNKTINEYLKLLTDKNTINSRYKITSEIKKGLFDKGGIAMSKEMMEVFDDVRTEAIKDGKVKVTVDLYNQKSIDLETAAGILNMSKDEFLKLV